MCDLSVMSSLKTARTLVVVGSDETSQEISLQFAPVTRLPEFLVNGKYPRVKSCSVAFLFVHGYQAFSS